MLLTELQEKKTTKTPQARESGVRALASAQVRELKGLWEEHVRFEDHRNFSAVPVREQKKMKLKIKTAAKSFKVKVFKPEIWLQNQIKNYTGRWSD